MLLPDDLGTEEVAAIIEAVLRTGTATTEQLERAAGWANQALVDAAMLRLVLDGRVDIQVPARGGDLKFGARA